MTDKVGYNKANDRIAFDRVGPYEVSTIFTSETWNGEPRYETVVFNTAKITTIEPLGDFADVEVEEDYQTLEEALAGHSKLVDEYRAKL